MQGYHIIHFLIKKKTNKILLEIGPIELLYTFFK